MSDYFLTTVRPPRIKRCHQGAQRQPITDGLYSPISILNDDVLLNIFYFFRLDVVSVYDEFEPSNLVNKWLSLRWWYKLAHVSRQWRRIILASPSLLDLHLLCANLNKVFVADMLAHSPPLPLAVCYSDITFNSITAEDEEHALLAISHRNRVHSIVLCMSAANLQRLIPAMDGEFPILEYLSINCRLQTDIISFTLPQTFQAPSLRHIYLWHVALPTRSPILTSNGSLVSLWLFNIPASAYFPPNYIIAHLSLMPQLEKLGVEFSFPIPNRDIVDTTIMTRHVILPNLRSFSFKGVTAYLESLLSRLTTPVLFAFHSSEDFLMTSTSLSLVFDPNFIVLRMDGHRGPCGRTFDLWIKCRYLDWQVASAARFLQSISPVLSVVEKLELNLNLGEHTGNQSSEWLNDVDRIQWRKLLEPFSNVKTLYVEKKLVRGVSCSLRLEDGVGEPSTELLPNLEEISYSEDLNVGYEVSDEFTPFINERQAAGHPVHVHSSWSWSPPWS